jgi:hypothetical protein
VDGHVAALTVVEGRQHQGADAERRWLAHGDPPPSPPAWDAAVHGGLAWLLARVGGSLQALLMPTTALPALVGLAQQLPQQPQPHQQQHEPWEGDRAPGLPLAAQLVRLERLELRGEGEAPLDAGGWASVLALPALRRLRIDGRRYDDDVGEDEGGWTSAVDLGDLGPLASRLVVLELIHWPVTSTAGLQACTSLRTLRLTMMSPEEPTPCGLTTAGVRGLGPLAGCASLTELDLSGNPLESLRPLEGLTSLIGAARP